MAGAVFCDVEGTLIDQSVALLSIQIGKRRRLLSRWQEIQVGLLLLVARLVPDRIRRQILLLGTLRLIAGWSEEKMERLIDALVLEVSGMIKPVMLERLRLHQADGLPLVLLSAGLHEIVVGIGEAIGARGEGTKLTRRNGQYTTRLEGAVCQGREKAARVSAILNELDVHPIDCYGYGDTANDVFFLSLVGHPHVVDPDVTLAGAASRRNWPVILTRMQPTKKVRNA